MHLIEIAFKGNRKEFFAWDGEEAPPLRSSVVVEADRGEDLGVVHAIGELAQKRCAGCSHGLGTSEPTRRALRVASTRDLRQARDVRAQDEVARQKAAARVKAHGLVMKLSDAEWQWDRKKLTFYFTADRRVDFRDLVRDLAALFRARIELKQIGVRDEAKRLDGVGRCGRQFCSASWLPELRPVNLGVAKDQRLSLNPSQISGACGRLMCCLRYEHELYVESRKRFPKEGKTLVTARGEEKVLANEIFNERVTLRSAEGETRVIPLTQLKRELAEAGQPLPSLETATGDTAELPVFAVERGDVEGELGIESGESFGGGEAIAAADFAETRDELPRTRAPSAAPPEAARPSAAPSGDRPDRGGRHRSRGRRPGQRPEAAEEAPPGETAARRTTEPEPAGSAPVLETSELSDEGRPGGSGSPRRRRGRRGGRRGRGRGGSGTGTPPSSDGPPVAGGGSEGSGSAGPMPPSGPA
jgi:cell fate regulator YaaT (PSP1 superfamily)